MFVAHIRETEEKEAQSVKEHLLGTAKLAREYANEFDNGTFAYSCGLLHDIGKYSKEFQKRICFDEGRCDHSTAGARVAMQNPIGFGKLAAYCIAGHHSGLLDIGSAADCSKEGTLYSRISNDNRIPQYESYASEIDESQIDFTIKALNLTTKSGGFSFAFFTRMIFSCLTDADFLDTECFMKKEERKVVLSGIFTELWKKLEAQIIKFDNCVGPVNEARRYILKNCIETANHNRGLFTLTVPTGGGKTISSMAFAMKHLLTNTMRRIIYVIPYTSIIEQNAKVFSDIFGEECILEHHSNYDFHVNVNEESVGKYKATENWDMPIIITTNVQFFESLFASKSSKCRKLHNIANSVIVFDEAQMLPIDYMKPTIMAITELVENYRCSCVLCSATQPALNNLFNKTSIPKEICQDARQYNKVFQRTQISYAGELEDIELVEQINKMKQVLIIVNTRKHAKALYKKIDGEGIYHLSTLMCPVHRKKMIHEIKQRLSEKKICKVVSTRLVEAGVDFDFPVVYRSLCGIDSIIQSAGRCNREGKLVGENGEKTQGQVYVFKEEEEYYKHMPYAMKLPIQITKTILEEEMDLNRQEVIQRYFSELFFYKGEQGLDIKEILKELDDGIIAGSHNKEDYFNYNFKSIAQKYKLLEDNTYAVIIPYDEYAEERIEKLDYIDIGKIALRQLQPYSVNIYSNEYNALVATGKVKVIAENMAVLRSKSEYHEDTGIDIDIKSGVGVFL